MSFFFFILYLAFSYLYPGEVFPELAQYRLAFWTGVLGLVSLLWSLPQVGGIARLKRPMLLMAGLMISMAVSLMWAERWLSAPLFVLQIFGPTLTMFLLALCTITTLRRLRITTLAMALLALALASQGAAAYHFGYMGDALLLHESIDDGPEEGATRIRICGLGLLNDPNDLALAMIATLPLLGLASKKGRKVRNILLVAVPGACLTYGIYLTRSRGGMLGVLAVLLAWFTWRFGRAKALVATGVM